LSSFWGSQGIASRFSDLLNDVVLGPRDDEAHEHLGIRVAHRNLHGRVQVVHRVVRSPGQSVVVVVDQAEDFLLKHGHHVDSGVIQPLPFRDHDSSEVFRGVLPFQVCGAELDIHDGPLGPERPWL
jgi:hypothetical protein